jgi:hypothetical protein
MANSVSPTAGGIMTAIGTVIALGVNAATGDTERGSAITVLVAGACYVAAGLVATVMRRDLLGPPREPGEPPPGRLISELGTVAAGLAAGVRYVVQRRGPLSALGATGGNRFLYGVLFLMSVLLYRNYFYPASVTGAEAHFTVLITVSAVGYGCAALVTPAVTRRIAKPTWIALLLAATAVLTAVLGETFAEVAFLVFGFCLNLAGQGVAICATTILQEDTGDSYRGRIFAFYDMTFNAAFAAGAAVSALFLPVTGRSPAIIGLVATGYAVVAAGYWLAVRQPGGEPGTSSPSD